MSEPASKPTLRLQMADLFTPTPAPDNVTITVPRRDLRIISSILMASANEWDPTVPENAEYIRHFGRKLKAAASKK